VTLRNSSINISILKGGALLSVGNALRYVSNTVYSAGTSGALWTPIYNFPGGLPELPGIVGNGGSMIWVFGGDLNSPSSTCYESNNGTFSPFPPVLLICIFTYLCSLSP
jgi:hypothetical protein